MENLSTWPAPPAWGAGPARALLELLQRLVDGDPRALRERVLKHWLKEVRADDAYIEAVELYAFDNLLEQRHAQAPRYSAGSPPRRSALPSRGSARSVSSSIVNSIHEQVVEKVLTLSFVMPKTAIGSPSAPATRSPSSAGVP